MASRAAPFSDTFLACKLFYLRMRLTSDPLVLFLLCGGFVYNEFCPLLFAFFAIGESLNVCGESAASNFPPIEECAIKDQPPSLPLFPYGVCLLECFICRCLFGLFRESAFSCPSMYSLTLCYLSHSPWGGIVRSFLSRGRLFFLFLASIWRTNASLFGEFPRVLFFFPSSRLFPLL